MIARRLAFAVFAGGVLGASGCLDHGVFKCKVNRDCGPQGFCESNGACSFASEGCTSGRRYGRHVQDDLSGRCVDPACPANPVLHVRAGGAHACLVRQNGKVACWGAGADGQLGDGTTLARSTVAPVDGLGLATDVALGDRHTCALLQDMTVWCWGANESGQLGDDTTLSRPGPALVLGLEGVVAIAAGGAFTCAARAEGNILCWGRNVDGELGTGSGPSPSLTPQPIALMNVQTLTARDRHACALTTGVLFCWGSNEQGELGDGTRETRRVPTAVIVPSGETWAAVAAGAAHTCALGVGVNGRLWCWGTNQLGELGDGTDETRVTPKLVPSLASTAVGAVAAAGHHTCVRRSDGTVLCWGANHAGQLGEGTTGNFRVPVPVTGIDNAADVTAGNAFSCARRRDGTIACWGDDRLGQLGTGSTIESLSPIRVANLDRAQAITAGAVHTCALVPASDGAASTVCWGDNQAGQIGDGTRLDRATPVALKISLNAREVVAGSLHTCLRGGDRSVWCWGRGGSGQLGTPAAIDFAVPVNLADLADVTRIAAGRTHTCALRQDTAWCWGANEDGQLGDGTNLGRSTAAAVPGPTDIVELALGGAHTCARHTDGTVTCWGRGTEGQLGDGAMTTIATPVVVSELTNAIGITAGDRHTCAARVDETVLCWGEGSSGQLGWGSSSLIGHKIPSLVKNLVEAVEIAAGGNHTCARTSRGNVLCWGANDAGQIGDGTHDTRGEPNGDLPSFTNAVAITAGGAHTCAIKSDQSVFCWGSDSSGQLGEGAFLQYPTARPTHISCP